MGERKVLSKYYPPDFDPSKLPRIQKKRQNDDAVRFMLPMSVRCETCGEFMGTGLKFNARKADTGDTYLGIRIFRFIMRCKGCPASFAILTDPKNGDYQCESGVRRNFEPWNETEKAESEAKRLREEQDKDAVQALENRTKDTKAHMDELDDLQAIINENAKRAKLGVVDQILKHRSRSLQTQDEILGSKADILLNQSKHATSTANESNSVENPLSYVKLDPPLLEKPKSSKSSIFHGTQVNVRIKKKIKKRPLHENVVTEVEPSCGKIPEKPKTPNHVPLGSGPSDVRKTQASNSTHVGPVAGLLNYNWSSSSSEER